VIEPHREIAERLEMLGHDWDLQHRLPLNGVCRNCKIKRYAFAAYPVVSRCENAPTPTKADLIEEVNRRSEPYKQELSKLAALVEPLS